ncbi:MAG: MarR family transcriptional regulator [Bacteroidota bacterium]
MDNTAILIKIRKIVRSINLESKKIQKEYGVSIPQVLCLGFLSHSDNYQSTHKQLREFLNLNSSTVTGIVDRLETKGLVARLPKKHDKRTTYIALTSRGSELLEKIPPLLHERLTARLNMLKSSDITIMMNTLDTIVDFLDAGNIDASPVITIEEDIDNSN